MIEVDDQVARIHQRESGDGLDAHPFRALDRCPMAKIWWDKIGRQCPPAILAFGIGVGQVFRVRRCLGERFAVCA
jgi:hypothetical protein